MKLVMSFEDDEIDTAQRMLDWHVYYVACANIATYCRQHSICNDTHVTNILSMLKFMENDDVMPSL
jgi:hypothetical protein